MTGGVPNTDRSMARNDARAVCASLAALTSLVHGFACQQTTRAFGGPYIGAAAMPEGVAGPYRHVFALGFSYTVHILYCAKKKMIPFKAHKLKPFQAKFIADATAPGIDMAALSVPRGTANRGWPLTCLHAP